MYKVLLFSIILCSFFKGFGQEYNTEIDTLIFQNRYTKIRTEAPTVPINVTKERAMVYGDTLKKTLKSFDNKQDKKYLATKEVYYKLQTLILFSFVIDNKYDSVVKYYDIITKECTNQNTLGSTNNYRSYAEQDRDNIVGALQYIEKAIQNFKLSGDKDSEHRAFLSLIKTHLVTENYEVVKDLLAVFKKENNIEELPNGIKGEYKIFNAKVVGELTNAENAIKLLTKIDLTNFKDDTLRLSNYYLTLIQFYLKSKQYDKALITIDEFNKTNLNYESQTITYHLFLAEAYLGLKDFAKTEYYLSLVKKTLTKQKLAVNHIAYNTLSYEYNKAKGNFKEALKYLEIVKSKKDSLDSKEYKLKASIQNYQIKKESELVILNEKNKAQDHLLIANKKFYTYITILISIIISVSIISIMLYFRKKKTFKLKMQNIKNLEIANLKSTYIENLSHEIRTPLTIIQGYLGLVRKNVFNSANVINYTNKTLKSTENIIKSLNDFLTILKLDKGEFTSQNSEENIGKFLDKTITSFEGITTLKKIKLYYKTNIKKTKKLENYDFSSLEKIINNLLTNAIKFSNTAASVFVETVLTNKELTIIVKDEGIGIEEKDISQIFSRFYQANENSINGGFGIGLSLVKQLVEKLEGKISVSSEKNIGSIFTVILPIQIKDYSLQLKENNTDYVLINEEIESINDSLDNDLEDNRPKILIADDDALILVYLKELLKTDFNCTTVFNGAEALELANKSQFDLIISDLRMPVLEGFELKKKLNALENYKDIPFLIMSASIYEEKSDLIISLGVDDFILKPFKSDELLTRIYNLLENKVFRNKLQKAVTDEKVEFFGHYSELMDKVNETIQKNLDNQDFSVDILAKECNYSKRQLGRILQSKTGLTPVKIILEVRLIKAYELLQKKEYQTIKEVVYAIGLNSVTYFNRAFQKRFGIKSKDLLN